MAQLPDFEREVRFLVPTNVIDLTKASEEACINDIYFIRDKVSIRLRSEQTKKSKSFELTFKFWETSGAIEKNIALSLSEGKLLLIAASEAGVLQIKKTRYIFPSGHFVWELDQYQPPLDFFVIAECEYKGAVPPARIFEKPE